MNRTIKFRAYDTQCKKWLDSVPNESFAKLLDDPNAEVCEPDSMDSWGNFFCYPANPLGTDHGGRIVFQQYTGLKDSKGKEIFEGDIVKTPLYLGDIKDQRCGEVKFLRGSFKANHKSLGDLDLGTWGFGDEAAKDFKIVGNIFDSPELLPELLN